MQQYHNSIFWVETEKINPNPYQPRKEFDPRALQDLADSIRQYGVLQPLVVTRKETETDDGMSVQYELIAGERRLRASKLAGLPLVPVIIRAGEDSDKEKLELAIIENLQREDLNPIDRAQAFLKLHEEFKLTHGEIGKKMGKSREYVSNSLRLLLLPEEIRQALAEKKIAEGHTRPLLMLSDRPAEQITLFKEMVIKRLSVRESEKIAREIATEKTRKKDLDPQMIDYQKKLSEKLGTRVSIEKREVGGKIVIDFFSPNDLQGILQMIQSVQQDLVVRPEELPATTTPQSFGQLPLAGEHPTSEFVESSEPEMQTAEMLDDRDQDQKDEEENTDLYNINNFTI
jgi:ParB family chromosome partitioning protein